MSIVDINSYKQEKPIRKFKKYFGLLFLLYILIYFMGHFEYYTPQALSRSFSQILNIDSIDTMEINVSSTKNSKIYSFNGGFIKADTDILSFISISGSPLMEIPILYQKPVLRIGDSNILVYNSDSLDYTIASSFGVTYKGTTNAKILSGSINSDDEYILVTDDSGYISGIRMYNTQNKEIFKWSTSKYNIISAKSSGNIIAATCIFGEGTDVSSTMVLFNKNSGEIISEVSLDKNFPIDFNFLDNSNISVITENQIYFIKTSGEIVQTIKTPDLKAYNINNNHNIAYAKKSFNSSSVISVVNALTFNQITKTIDEDVLKLSVTDDFIYILTKNSILKYDLSLNKLDESSHNGGISDIIVHSTGDIYGVYFNKLVKNP